MAIKAILFDLDRTLLDRDCGLISFGRDIGKTYKRKKSFNEELFMKRLIALDNQGKSRKYEVFAALSFEFFEDDCANELTAQFYETFPKYLFPFADVPRCLLNLRRQNYILAVVSNGRSIFQRKKLFHSGLERFIDYSIISDEENVAKPDPKIFITALNRAKITPEEGLFVGDSEATDIKGANRVGLTTVLRRYKNDLFQTAADYEINTISSIQHVLSQLIR